MRIYIRHAEKAYKNGKSKTLKHDPALTEEGKLQARALALKLVSLYGVPKIIICSPYLRTRQTAHEMATVLNDSIPIDIDVDLSEYLGNQKHASLDVTPETAFYKPPHPERFHQFEARVRRHLRHALDDDVVWYVSHGLTIGTIYKNLCGHRPHIPYLGTMIVQDDNIYFDPPL